MTRIYIGGWLVALFVALGLMGTAPSYAQAKLPRPQQPLQAWTVAADGAVFVVDARGRLVQLTPKTLTPVAQSRPLVPRAAKAPTHLLASAGQIFISSEAISQTLVLDRAGFRVQTRLEQAGPLALDPGRRLFLIAWTGPRPRPYTGQITVYALADLTQPPQLLETGCLSGPLTVNPAGRRLYVQERKCQNSPPHQGDVIHIYDLDSLQTRATFQPEPFRGALTRPAVAAQSGTVAAINHGLNGVADLYLFDDGGRVLHGLKGTQPGTNLVLDSAGEWLYLLEPRGLAVLTVPDLTLTSLLPLTPTVPTGVALASDDQTLYVFGNGWLTAYATSALQEAGVQP